MAFERFTESGRSYKAKLSIRSNGQIGLNQGAYNRFNLGDYNYVVLFYDKDDNKIGLRFLHEMEEHALKYRNKHENISISARSFFCFKLRLKAVNFPRIKHNCIGY